MAVNAPSPYDSAELFHACGSDNVADQERAYRTLWDYLFRVAYSIVYRQPDADALAQDAAQLALIKVHDQRENCQEPQAFRVWSRRIVSNITIDELRRRKRLLPLTEQNEQRSGSNSPITAVLQDNTLDRLSRQSLRHLLAAAPISDRSRRVVIGRFLDDLPDELLAQHESELAGNEIRPSHIQVTRAKNITKLRRWDELLTFLREAT